MVQEHVYIAHDNAIDLELGSDGAAVDLTPVTGLELIDVRGLWKISSSVNPGVFSWGGALSKGVVNIKLGGTGIPRGTHSCYLNVVDPTNPSGVIWGDAPIVIKVVAVREPV